MVARHRFCVSFHFRYGDLQRFENKLVKMGLDWARLDMGASGLVRNCGELGSCPIFLLAEVFGGICLDWSPPVQHEARSVWQTRVPNSPRLKTKAPGMMRSEGPD